MNCSVAIGSYIGNGNTNRTISFTGYDVQAILIENDYLGSRYSGSNTASRYGALVLKNHPVRNKSGSAVLQIDNNESLEIASSNFNISDTNYHYLIFYIP